MANPQGSEKSRASLALLYEIGREVATALDLKTVLQRVLFLSMKYVEAISGSILVIDDVGQPIDSAFSILGKAHDESALQLSVTYERGMAGWVARHQEAVLIPDTSQDDRWLQRPDDATSQTGPKSAISAPITTHEGLVGVITLVHPRPGFFTPDHLDLLKAIAGHAGAAIRNARLFEELQAAHKRYWELFEDSIDLILISEMDGEVIEVNRQAEKMIGMERSQILRMNVRDLTSLSQTSPGPSALPPDFDSLPEGETISGESILKPTGELKIPVQVYVRKIRQAGVCQLQWILRDISERKDLDALREDLIAMVYHDLRSPLANISSSLEVLQSVSSEEDESTQSLLSIALRSTNRIQRLTSSLLDINRLEAGQPIATPLAVDPAGLIADAVSAVFPNLSARELDLTSEVAEDIPRVLADPDMIRRVLINLLENAIKFTPTKGKIHVSAQPWRGMVEFAVSDTGNGIPAGDRDRIFEKFSRLSPAEGPRGLGLGLAYCRLAVQAHGGEIWVESEQGKGSEFKFRIPAASRPD